MTRKKIRVLVVDDSLVSRELIVRGISTDPMIEVVAKAVDPFDARDKIIEYRPDVMTCDIEMPKMNGIDFIRRLLPQYSLPVVVVSTISDAVFNALDAGAVDFVTKPNEQSKKSVDSFTNELITKIKIASIAKVNKDINQKVLIPTVKANFVNNQGILAIGASTGGTEAITHIVKALPPTIMGTVIVQHIPPIFSKLFAERLNSIVSLQVKEAQTGDYIEEGKVLIAPGDRHMKIKKIGQRYKVECFSGAKVNGHCPSVDVLFESVAQAVGNKAIGVILTGMGYDGAKGLLAMKRKGARTLGQDERSSVVYGMPKVAYELGAVDKQVALENIPREIYAILQEMEK